MKRIVIKLIVLFIIIILFFKIVVIARYYEKIGNIKVAASIAEPIMRVESSNETKFIEMNSQSGNKEYYFTIKNYYIDEKNNKRINEIDFNFNIEIRISDKNFPVEYKLYDCNTQKEIQNYQFQMPKSIEFENKYKLVVFWKEKSIMSKITDIEIAVNGKFVNSKLKAFTLTRDNIPIIYNINKSNNEYTNQNIVLTIEFNKQVKNIEGFSISQDGKKLTKVIENNETATIIVEDISGNKTPIMYEINNIDKIPPEIIGIEDGKIYCGEVNINYRDNFGIKDIIILNKYTKTDYINPYKLTENGVYDIIVTDLAGNKTRKRISIT